MIPILCTATPLPNGFTRYDIRCGLGPQSRLELRAPDDDIIYACWFNGLYDAQRCRFTHIARRDDLTPHLAFGTVFRLRPPP